MIKKYWIGTSAFLTLAATSVFLLWSGDTVLGKEISSIVFSIVATGTTVLGIGLYTWIRLDINLNEKPTEEQLKEQEKWAGRIEVVKEQIHFFYDDNEKLIINLSEIKVIGEMTTEADPSTIDWYLVLVKINNEAIYLPAYAVGFQEALNKISQILGEQIMPKLFSSIKFDSSVIFPKSLQNETLFYFEELTPAGFWNKIKLTLGYKPITPVLKDKIVEFEKSIL